jgi:hypothetical protein
MKKDFALANTSALINFASGADSYEQAVSNVCKHTMKEDQTPVFAELDTLVYLWELKYGHPAVSIEDIAKDSFMTLTALRLNREGKLLPMEWDDKKGYQLNANS